MHSSANDIVFQCQTWLTDFIIKYGICPFAKAVYDNNDVEFNIVDSSDLEEQVVSLMQHVHAMTSEAKPDTKLIIFAKGVSAFDDYLYLLDLCNEMIEQHELTDVIQLASFHPNYLFEGEAAESTSHYTNRAPWPMIHIIRQDSVAKALANYPDPENIPQRNVDLAVRALRYLILSKINDLQIHEGDNAMVVPKLRRFH